MAHPYWNDWYFGWGWFLLISSFGHWGYTYRSNRRYSEMPQKKAVYILNERYAQGEISHEEFGRMKLEISTP